MYKRQATVLAGLSRDALHLPRLAAKDLEGREPFDNVKKRARKMLQLLPLLLLYAASCEANEPVSYTSRCV